MSVFLTCCPSAAAADAAALSDHYPGLAAAQFPASVAAALRTAADSSRSAGSAPPEIGVLKIKIELSPHGGMGFN